MTVSIAGRAPFLNDPNLQRLLAALTVDGEEARIAGGAVRDALLGREIGDVDIATTNLPQATLDRATGAGFRAIPTGFDHGTVTVIVNGKPVEVTTLRADVETDGRHAKVAFGRDWQADAERRDFTINGLYALPNGEVVDLVGGLGDIDMKLLRFIGDPEDRIREDYLRVLRFFRFFAWHGSGRPDAEGLKASARLKEGLTGLSAERVWMEMRKLLAAPDPSRALLWMRQASVLTTVMPETEKWGIDAIHGLVAAERENGWPPDPLLRLMAIIPPNAERIDSLATRLRFSNVETKRLQAWAQVGDLTDDLSQTDLDRLAYSKGREAVMDRLQLKAGSAIASEKPTDHFVNALQHLEGWRQPRLPISGADLVASGMKPGPEMGKRLAELEAEWIASGFKLDRETLLEKL